MLISLKIPMSFFKVVDYLFIYGKDEEDTLDNVNQLVSGARFRESYKMRGCPKLGDDGRWKAIVELATINGVPVSKKSYSYSKDKKLFLEVKELEKNTIMEHLRSSRQVAQDYVHSLENCFGIRCCSQEEILDSLKDVGLSKTADNYGLPRDGLLKLHDLNLRKVQEYFHQSKKRPVQKCIADKLGVTVDYLEDLRKRKLA